MAILFNRRSTFGTYCIRCSDELIAPVRSEYRNEREVRHRWRCPNCRTCFETIVDAKSAAKDDIVLLVA